MFDYATPTLLTAYTAHFVHFDPAHLSINLGSYLLLVPVTYALAALSDELSRFRVAVVTLHTAVPLALSGLNLALVRPRVGYGFSGVAASLFFAVWVDAFSLSQLPDTVWMATVVAAFAASAVVHTYCVPGFELGADGTPPEIETDET